MTDASQPIDPTLKIFVDISRMSSDLRGQHYLQVLLVRNDTRLKFQIIGNLAVKIGKIKLPNGIVLEPHPLGELDGKQINEVTHEE